MFLGIGSCVASKNNNYPLILGGLIDIVTGIVLITLAKQKLVSGNHGKFHAMRIIGQLEVGIPLGVVIFKIGRLVCGNKNRT